MNSEVEFMGGPMHGKVLGLPEDPPPPTLVVMTPPPDMSKMNPAALGAVVFEPREFAYARQVSSLDTGPLWVYVPLEGGL